MIPFRPLIVLRKLGTEPAFGKYTENRRPSALPMRRDAGFDLLASVYGTPGAAGEHKIACFSP